MPKGKMNQKYKFVYSKLNEKYFEGRLSKDLIISESSLLRRKAGVSYFNYFRNGVIEPTEITISKQYILKYPLDLVGVLLHEMIHIKLKSNEHNTKFINELNRLRKDYGVYVPLVGKSLV